MDTIHDLFKAVYAINAPIRKWALMIGDYDLKMALFRAASGKPFKPVVGAAGVTVNYYPHWQNNPEQPDWRQAWISIKGDDIIVELLTGKSTYAAFKKRGKSTKVQQTFVIPREKINVWVVAERLSGERYNEYSLDINIPEDEEITQ
jgi:hypothetical protein